MRCNALVEYDDGTRNITVEDNPEEWSALMEWAQKNQIGAYVPPVAPPLTIISARYANEQETAAVAETKEAGSVAYECEQPEKWIELMDATNGEIADYVPAQ